MSRLPVWQAGPRAISMSPSPEAGPCRQRPSTGKPLRLGVLGPGPAVLPRPRTAIVTRGWMVGGSPLITLNQETEC